MNFIKKAEETFLGVSIIIATFVLFTNVVLRYLFKSSTIWAEELIRYIMIWITFIGSSVCFRQETHVGIDFFVDYLPKGINKALKICITIISIAFCILLVVYGVKITLFNMNTGQVSPALQAPIYIVYMVIPLSSLLSLIHLFNTLKKCFILEDPNDTEVGS